MLQRHLFIAFLIVLFSFHQVFSKNDKQNSNEHSLYSWSSNMKYDILFSEYNGIILSFADFNRDRHTDVLIANPECSEVGEVCLDLLLMKKSHEPFILYTPKHDYIKKITLLHWTPPNNVNHKKIRAAIVSDFDGDSLIDILLMIREDVTSDSDIKPYDLWISYQQKEYVTKKENDHLNMSDPVYLTSTTDHPLLLDYNADSLADLLIQSLSGETELFLGNPYRHMTNMSLPIKYKWAKPGYSSFVDALSTMEPGIFLTLTSGKEQNASIFYHFYPHTKQGSFDWNSPMEITLPQGKIFGPPVFADWKAEGKTSLLLAYCNDSDCNQSHLSLYNFTQQKWSDIPLNWNEWKLQPSNLNPLQNFILLPPIMPMRVGHISLTQYPEAVLLLQHRELQDINQVFILSVENNNNVYLSKLENFQQSISDAPLFDFDEDGMLGMWIMSKPDGNGSFHLARYMPSDASDNYFLKVMMLNGLCSSDCPSFLSGLLPYGLPLPGTTLNYQMENEHGHEVNGHGSILANAGFHSLSLPFHLFGLGTESNYVEILKVSVPSNDSNKRNHEYSFVVPKTQLVIIPHPLTEPAKWKTQLFINPLYEWRVVYVAGALMVIGAIVFVILCILQIREYREDRFEKMKETQKFSFDAM